MVEGKNKEIGSKKPDSQKVSDEQARLRPVFDSDYLKDLLGKSRPKTSHKPNEQ